MTKIEIGEQRPAHFQQYWPGQYDTFSHLEYACGIPSILFAITTLKENGKPNVNFSAWSSFGGDGRGYYAVMPGMLHHTHTYANIRRTGEFVINFLNPGYFDACSATIRANDDEADEIAAGSFTREDAATVACPRLQEAFLSLECTLEREVTLGDAAISSILIGRVRHIAADAGYANGIDGKYGESGFMLHIHAPKNLTTGEGQASAVAVCRIVRVNEGG